MKVAQACGVSLSSVFRIIKEACADTADIKSFSTSHKKCSTKEIKTDLDNFDKCTILLIIYIIVYRYFLFNAGSVCKLDLEYTGHSMINLIKG